MQARILFEIAGIFILAVIFFQDMKARAVSWILFPLLGVAYISRFLFADYDFIYPLFNYAFLVIQLAGVSLYVLLKYKSIKLFNQYLGLGDILYWIVIAWFFSPLNFIVYHVIGLLFAVITYLLFLRSAKKTIPQAGLQSLLLMLLTVVSWFTPACDTYNDSLILTILQ